MDDKPPDRRVHRLRRRVERSSKKGWAGFAALATAVVLIVALIGSVSTLAGDALDVGRAALRLIDGGGRSGGRTGRGGGATSGPTSGGGNRAAPPYVDTGGGPASLRAAATLNAAILARIPDNTLVTILCTEHGDALVGYLGASAIWDRLRVGDKIGFVNDSLIFTGIATATKRACP
jgi:hypothetical protein